MRVLIACEESQTVCKAFRKLGHEAYSCDTAEPSGGRSEWHIQGDAINAAYNMGPWDLMIAHPPCTYLSVSGLHWNKRIPGRDEKTEAALRFVRCLMDAPVKKIVIENPVSCISTMIRKPEQIIQPYEYGDDASKKTCLWIKGLPRLVPTGFIPPRMVNGKPRWRNQTDSGQNKLGPSPDRSRLRSKTYQGIADAMAAQWGGKCDN